MLFVNVFGVSGLFKGRIRGVEVMLILMRIKIKIIMRDNWIWFIFDECLLNM